MEMRGNGAPQNEETETMPNQLTENQATILTICRDSFKHKTVEGALKERDFHITVEALVEKTHLAPVVLKPAVRGLFVRQLAEPDNGEGFHLTEDGVRLAFELEPPSEIVRVGHVTCSDLRSIAVGWKGDRKGFIDHAVAIGANPRTAATQWHVGRKGK